MAQLIVRSLDEDLVARLKKRAAERGVSAEAEHRAILETALRPQVAEFWDRAKTVRESLQGRPVGDSARIIREMRDTRYGGE